MERKKKYELIIGIFIFILIVFLTMILFNYFKIGKVTTESIGIVKGFILGFGNFAPVVFVLLQALQVVLAPIPGGIIGVVGGLAFGGFLGSILGIIGITLGSIIAFFIARKFGRPAVAYFVDKKNLAKFDDFFVKNGAFTLFMIYILPFFPDDLFCYFAGLSKMDFKKFLIVTIVGRGINAIYLAYFGSELGFMMWHLWIFFVIMAISAIAFLFRKDIQKLVH